MSRRQILCGWQHITSIEEDHQEQTELHTNEDNTNPISFYDISRVPPSLQEQMNLSHMDTNNIIMVIQMEYERSNEYKCKSTLGFGIATS
jgi:hypothetical protein